VPPGPPGGPPRAIEGPRGLRKNSPGALPGYTLIAPLSSNTIYLVDMEGRVVHRWDTKYSPGSEIFLDDGHLLRCSQEPNFPKFNSGGACGRIQELDWDGNVVWDYLLAADDRMQHHDLERLPDGNVLLIVEHEKSRADAVAAGRAPAGIAKGGMWAESIVEIEPARPSGGEVVWEWHVWDHLVQDFDKDAENYGRVAEHPELLDLNCDLRPDAPEGASEEEIEEMKRLGYVGNAPARGEVSPDWMHVNAVDYDAEHDQIVFGSPHLNEVWIIDHSTTIDEAAGHEGGLAGKGGDLLWRWGNPRNYLAGTAKDQKLFGQHDPRFVRAGAPGAGRVMIFNNGARRPDGNWSDVIELALPRRKEGGFTHELGLPFEPAAPAWSYAAPTKSDFFSGFISGATRLSNGNTFVCEGATGRVFEVTPAGEIVWEFLNPWSGEVRSGPGAGAPPHALFRATRIPADHPGLKGRKLEPIARDA
jgi:hypothetical protein